MDYENDIEECLRVLKTGGLILYPTDTVWGIGCDATDANAVEKVYRLKQRNDNKAMIVLVAGERDIVKYVAHPDPKVFEYLQQAKKPTTVVYEGAIGLADNLVSKDGSIAIRICKNTFCRHLVKRFRRPIVSTSANISGEKTPLIFNDIENTIKSGVDYIVNYQQDNNVVSAPSSLVAWNKDGTITVLRP